jgi:hypothetical protein
MYDFGLLVIIAIPALIVWLELLRRINALRHEMLKQVATQRLQLGDFQMRPEGDKLEFRKGGILLAELGRDGLCLHGTFLGSDGQRAEYCGTGLRFYDGRGAARVRVDVDDADSSLTLAGGERFEGELAVERESTPPPPGYGIPINQALSGQV